MFCKKYQLMNSTLRPPPAGLSFTPIQPIIYFIRRRNIEYRNYYYKEYKLKSNEKKKQQKTVQAEG